MAKKRGEQEESGNDVESGEARVYELGFHLDPELPADEVKKAYNELRAQVSKASEVVAEGEPRRVALAYTISRQATGGRRDFDAAYFAWIAYEAPAEAHQSIVAAAGADSRVIRFIDLTTDKEAARAAAEREAFAAKAPESAHQAESEPEPAMTDAALDAALENAAL